jgi:hypothetical protein
MADLSSKTLKQAQPGLLHLDNGGTPIDASGTARRVDGGGGTDTALWLSSTRLGINVSPTEDLHIKGVAANTTLKLDSPAGNDAELKFSDNGTDKWNIYMDDSDDHKLKFIADDNGDLIIATFDKDGLFGIGTANPTRELDVHFAGADTGVGIVCYSDTADHNATIVFEKSHNDTMGTDTATIDTEILGGLNFSGNNGTIFKTGAKLQVFQNGAMGTLPPTELVYTNSGTSGGALVDVWKIDKSGNMALGTRAANTTDLSGTTFDIQKSTGDLIVNWESDDDDVQLILDSHTSKDSRIDFNTAGTAKWILWKDGSESDSLRLVNGSASQIFGIEQSSGKINLGGATDVNFDDALVNIENTNASFGAELLQLKQADVDQPFLKFDGTSASDSSKSLSASTATAGNKVGAIRVKIGGDTRWIRFYDSAE